MNKGQESVKREELIIDVKTEAMEDMIRTNVRLADENKDLKEKLEKIASVEFKRKKERLGAPENIESIDDLKAWEKEHEGETVGVRTGGGTAGRSSLNDDGNQPTGKKTFSSKKDLAQNVDEQTKNKIWSKVVDGIREQDGALHMSFSEAEKEFATEGIYHTDKSKFRLEGEK